MTRAYYNENEPFAVQWLRNLIDAGLIAPGDVDDRSIIDVRPNDLRGYTQCHFFAGIGGWSYAARLAGWPDSRPIWTGSCPCQPFSNAGKRKGFDDDRHLWPVWSELIRERGPSVVFGEQVASASEWLRLVRGDLEEMGYAVGAMPVEAASAGADHIRDRYWFVADASLPSQERQRRNGGQVLPVKAAIGCGRSGDMGHAGGAGLAVGSVAEIRRGNLWEEGQAATKAGSRSVALAYANEFGASEKWEQRSGELGRPGRDQEARDCHLANGNRQPERWKSGQEGGTPSSCQGEMEGHIRERDGLLDSGTCEVFEWVIGADGKARRVKPGIRLLADGVSNRVGLLRGFGNAIDPRPAAQFIGAYLDHLQAQEVAA